MRSEHSDKSTLHRKLVKSIEELTHDSRGVDANRLQNILLALKNIPVSDIKYQEILGFSFLLINEIPSVLKNPRNHAIRELANECRLFHEETLRAEHRVGANPRSK